MAAMYHTRGARHVEPDRLQHELPHHAGPGLGGDSLEMIHETRIIPLDGRPALPSNVPSGSEIPAGSGRATRWSSRRPTSAPKCTVSGRSETGTRGQTRA